jgi:hypothetical protein
MLEFAYTRAACWETSHYSIRVFGQFELWALHADRAPIEVLQPFLRIDT